MRKCTYCEEPAVTSALVRVGAIPKDWDTNRHAVDKSSIKVIRYCAGHKEKMLK